MVLARVAFSKPTPVVAFPCGSRSTRRTFLFSIESPAARLTAVVVFPVPPLLFRTLMIKASCMRFGMITKRMIHRKQTINELRCMRLARKEWV